jgi:uncharacterized protein YndB with AHSA1/START domain
VSDGTYSAAVRIAAPPEAVFPYLTDAALVVRWMGDWAELDPRPNGAVAIDINGVPIRGRFLEVDPPRRLVFTWGTPGSDTLPPGSTTVEISLQVDGDGTVVELVHRDLPPDELPKHDTGWQHFLGRLVVAAAGGDPGRDPWAVAPV